MLQCIITFTCKRPSQVFLFPFCYAECVVDQLYGWLVGCVVSGKTTTSKPGTAVSRDKQPFLSHHNGKTRAVTMLECFQDPTMR